MTEIETTNTTLSLKNTEAFATSIEPGQPAHQ
jgi:hypothetical protein